MKNYRETESETGRKVSYDTERAHINVIIPKRTASEQAEYERRVRAALRRFYHHVTIDRGHDWDELVGGHTEREVHNGSTDSRSRHPATHE